MNLDDMRPVGRLGGASKTLSLWRWRVDPSGSHHDEIESPQPTDPEPRTAWPVSAPILEVDQEWDSAHEAIAVLSEHSIPAVQSFAARDGSTGRPLYLTLLRWELQ